VRSCDYGMLCCGFNRWLCARQDLRTVLCCARPVWGALYSPSSSPFRQLRRSTDHRAGHGWTMQRRRTAWVVMRGLILANAGHPRQAVKAVLDCACRGDGAAYDTGVQLQAVLRQSRTLSTGCSTCVCSLSHQPRRAERKSRSHGRSGFQNGRDNCLLAYPLNASSALLGLRYRRSQRSIRLSLSSPT